MPNIQAPFKAKVSVTEELQSQIHFLHARCPNDIEWSGLLIYKVDKGSLETYEGLEITAHAMYPMNYGNQVFTSFEAGPDWFKAFEQYPQVDPMNPEPGWFIGKIHSHHSMPVYHSSTDMTDLENAHNLPMLLSLIVNYRGELDCKLAVAIESKETKITKKETKIRGFKDWQREEKVEEKVEKPVFIIDCLCYYLQDGWIITQTDELYKEHKRQPIIYDNKSAEYTYGKTDKKYSEPDKDKTTTPTFKLSTDLPSHVSDKTRTRVYHEFPDLISLGIVQYGLPIDVMKDVNRFIDVENRGTYKKAFKQYFEEWYEMNFNTNFLTIPRREAIEGVRYHINKTGQGWLQSVLIECVNELYAEQDSTRPI